MFARQMLQRRRRHRDVFGERAGPDHADHGHARLERGDVAGCGIDHAGEFRTRHEGQRILGLIQSLHLQPVDEADGSSADPDADLAWRDIRHWHLLDGDAVNRIVILDHHGLHAIIPKVFPAAVLRAGLLLSLQILHAQRYSAASACRSICSAPDLINGMRSRPIAIVSCGFSNPRSRKEWMPSR